MTARTDWIPGTTPPVRRGWYERAAPLAGGGEYHLVPAMWGGRYWYVWYQGSLVLSRISPRTFLWRGATVPQEGT